MQKCTNKGQAQNEMKSLAISRFDIPGDPGFPLNSVYRYFSLMYVLSLLLHLVSFSKPSNQNDTELLKMYLTQVRQEVGMRVCEKVFGDDGKPSKWWLCFAKKKFMDKSLSGPGQ